MQKRVQIFMPFHDFQEKSELFISVIFLYANYLLESDAIEESMERVVLLGGVENTILWIAFALIEY